MHSWLQQCKKTGNTWVTNSSIDSPICQERQSERTFPIFPLFPDFFPLFLDSLPLFPKFLAIFFFCCQGGHSAPWPPGSTPLVTKDYSGIWAIEVGKGVKNNSPVRFWDFCFLHTVGIGNFKGWFLKITPLEEPLAVLYTYGQMS